jgi:hypothetical protein
MVATKTRAAIVGVGVGIFSFAFLIGVSASLAGVLDASWTAPTTNADGSALIDLASYRLYYGAQSAPCPGTTRAQVASPTTSPGANQTMTFRLTGLAAGTRYSVAVTAVDAAGNESACSGVASAVARAEFSVSPSGTVNFGAVNLGSFAEQTFTVSNTGGAALSGTASIAAPFSVVSGSPFTLAGLGASQAVRVRFTPTTTTTMSTNLAFNVGGDTISVAATGSGAGAAPLPSDTIRPTVGVTAPSAGTTVSGTITVSANATDNVAVVGVQFKLDGANLGAERTTPPYSVTWNTTMVSDGAHVLTAAARDAAGNVATSAGVTVTVANATAVDTSRPVISGLSLAVTSSSATLGWTTNEPSDTQVEYGVTRSYGTMAPLNTTLTTSHRQVVTGLRPNTWYHVRLRSRDAAGNLSLSRDLRFKTRGR